MPSSADLAIASAAIVHCFDKLFSRFHWTSILSALLIASAVWAWRRRVEPENTPASLRLFLFPRATWLHRSALLDYRFVLFDKVVLAALIGFGALFVSPKHVDALAKGSHWIAHDGSHAGVGIIIAYTAALLFAEEFFRYWAHRWLHESPFLWQFHKVHHSAEVLVPVSQLREHPVEGIVNLVRGVLAIPLVTGVFLLVFPGRLTEISILGVNAGRFVFDIAGAQLRHSHVWISFGPFWERLVISPAQHQVHHSVAPEHINRNYGSQLALWDWLFGTLYVPERREELRFGVEGADRERLTSVKALYWLPVKDAWAMARRARARRKARRAAEGRSWPEQERRRAM